MDPLVAPWVSPDTSVKTPDLNQWQVRSVIHRNVRNVPLSFILVLHPAPMLCKVLAQLQRFTHVKILKFKSDENGLTNHIPFYS